VFLDFWVSYLAGRGGGVTRPLGGGPFGSGVVSGHHLLLHVIY
jgi:hypothetical protein